MQDRSRIEVNLDALEHNASVVRRACAAGAGTRGGAVGICAVLKADGYGLGAVELARRLEQCGVEMAAVYAPEDAGRLVEAGITTPILVLAPVESLGFDGALFLAVRGGRVHFAAHSMVQVEALEASAALIGVKLPVHVEVDTGMSRGGVGPDEAAKVVGHVVASERLRLAGVFSHLASADRDPFVTREQNEKFALWLARVRPLLPQSCAVHLANSFGLFRATTLHRDMVRVGLALLGYAEEEFRDVAAFELAGVAHDLAPVVRWSSRIVHVSRIEAGAPAGYGSTWRAKRATRLGLVPVGYADGYPLALGNTGMLGIETAPGKMVHAPIVGAVSMDQVTIDLTDLPESAAGVATPVEIVSADRSAPNHLPALAKAAGTITHELLCRLSPRVARRYISRGAEVARTPAQTLQPSSVK